MSEGYLLDQDDRWYYIGDTPDAVSECIEKTQVVRCVNSIEAEMEKVFGEEIPDEGDVH